MASVQDLKRRVRSVRNTRKITKAMELVASARLRRALNRGEKMVATLNQPQYQPWPMEEQVAALYAGVNGFLDEIPVEQVPRFNEELIEHLRAEGSILEDIRESGDLSDETAEKLEAEIKKALGSFNIQEKDALVS